MYCGGFGCTFISMEVNVKIRLEFSQLGRSICINEAELNIYEVNKTCFHLFVLCPVVLHLHNHHFLH